MNPLLWMVVMFGLVGPFCCFIVGFPFWINLLLSLLGLVLGEQTMAKFKNLAPGSKWIDPNDPGAFEA